MARKLLIVESPGKLKTLRKILGPEWAIEASVGHTTELAHDGPRRLGFEIKLTPDGPRVETHYIPRGERGREVLARLRKVARSAERVYLATDPDREGEAIAWHLAEQLELRNFCRVSYTQITESAVRQAIQKPGSLDLSLVGSQKARQCLDKLVGFEVSPLLWNSTGGKSAGRVQSSTLHLVCERERERIAFKPEKYWLLRSIYGEGFEALYEPEAAAKAISPKSSDPGTRRAPELEPGRVSSEDEAKLIAEVARTSPHLVDRVETQEESRNPPPPLITSTLQQMAGARYRYSPKKTMQLAQELYEGIGGKGLITYMRTDSIALSPEFVEEARGWIAEKAPEALPERARFFKPKEDAQGAHEAIRPTSAGLTPEGAARMLNPEQLNIYRLIWERAIASQCKPARLSRTKIRIDCGDTRWVARGMTVIDPGYLRFWKNTEDEKLLPELHQGQRLDFKDVRIDGRVTEPPPRYTEPKLVQLMEKRGIGRPSTYASTIATLKDREYVTLEKQFVVPTKLGMATDETLARAIPDLVNPEFTAKMETSLDKIAAGLLAWESYLYDWNRSYFEPALTAARKAIGATRTTATAKAKPRASGAPRSTHARGANLLKGPAPICPRGHGNLTPATSKKGAPYWRCPERSCDAFAWHRELSREKCPECRKPLEKVRSPKVTGGYFLKCARKEDHPREVVLFRNRQTRAWERGR